jgi:endonuclease I
LHNLLVTDTAANLASAGVPKGVVVQPIWARGGSKKGYDAQGRLVFEPRDEVKGRVARALVYAAVVYGVPLDPVELATIVGWHRQFPPTHEERARNDRIERVQGNRNLFVDDPDLVFRCLGDLLARATQSAQLSAAADRVKS